MAAVGAITSSNGAGPRVCMQASFFDVDGNLPGNSAERQWCLTMHEYNPIELLIALADPSQVARSQGAQGLMRFEHTASLGVLRTEAIKPL